MNTGRPTRAMLANEDTLLALLSDLYDAAKEAERDRFPSSIPALKAITLPTYLALRAQAGDTAGEKGPRACLLAGKSGPVDGGQGVFVWDAASTLTDDNATVIQVTGIVTGRWRKVL